MTPQDLAVIHARAFAHERGWSTGEFETLLAQPYTRIYTQAGGFALTRTLAGESELLTLAVDPAQQRRGIARALMAAWLEAVTPVAQSAFLEVAADNHAALSLYDGLSFQRSGLRRAYYARKGQPAVDAVLMQREIIAA